MGRAGFPGAATGRGYGNSSNQKQLKLRLEQRRRALGAASKLQGEESEDVGHRRFQFRNQTLRTPAEEGVKDHRRNTNRQPGCGIKKRFTDAMRKLHVTLTPNIRAERAKGANNSDHRPKQAKEWRNHSDIGEISYSVIQIRSDTSSFRLGNFTDLLEIGIRIFGGEIEDLLDDAGDGFAVTIGNSQKAQIIAFPQQRICGGHKSVRNNRATANAKKVNDDKHDRNN